MYRLLCVWFMGWILLSIYQIMMSGYGWELMLLNLIMLCVVLYIKGKLGVSYGKLF
jgi:hypothetical protein